MNNRKAELQSLIKKEEYYNRLIWKEWYKKIPIYADMLFLMNEYDFIDLWLGCMAYSTGFIATMIAVKAPDAIYKVCVDPEIFAQEAIASACFAMLFGTTHMLYRAIDNYDLELANNSIEHYTELKRDAENRRYTLFPESRSYFSSAVESVRKFVGI